MPPHPTVIGRFAPSPTGPLHLGSLYTALASFLAARSQQGRWLLRIDDLDTARNVRGADALILSTLSAFGLDWDGPVVYQSQHLDAYQDFLNRLADGDWVYRCLCSRKMLSADIYSGRCRPLAIAPDTAHALRVKTDTRTVSFHDEWQGGISHSLAERHGDFILKRRDQVIAYQFAVVIDDHLQQVNQVVRGFDLLDVTPRQIYLQQLLGLATPRYGHVPIIVDQHGNKLSKQSYAAAVDATRPERVLFNLLTLLKQQPPQTLQGASVDELLAWAIAHWNPAPLQRCRQLRDTD